MDGNKDEALKCIQIAQDAIASGNKDRALKFIGIARRLNSSLSLDELLLECENLDSESPRSSNEEKHVRDDKMKDDLGKGNESVSKERNYTEEHVLLIREIKRHIDYYEILGVEKTCSVEEIRKAYRKLSLKVHPDKNKAPGSEEAFKKVCKAFKCLSDDNSRRHYDQVGLVDEFDHNQRHNVSRQRRRRYGHDMNSDDFDPDEIFRSFFGQGDVFRASHVRRSRAAPNRHQEENPGGGPSLLTLLQILPFLLIFLLAYLPFSEPEYSLHKNYAYQIPKTTEKHGIEFYVKSHAFDEKFPLDSSARVGIEDNVIRDYKNLLGRYCHVELQKRRWNNNLPTPHCNKLKDLGYVGRYGQQLL